ncbi:MAG: M20/M25/M40 family metallo-hydrolase [Proteobacteria bacterium]|nr:M20/M25/M40 family metallo-hydrolase [Pseudomonadota bacterium]
MKTNHCKALQTIHREIDMMFPDHLEKCREFLRQKSVSATGEGLLGTAELIRERLEGIGAEVWFYGQDKSPIILGQYGGDHSRTLLIYGMYDVQPAEEQGWISPPFEAKIVNLPRFGDCVIARGAVNSKGALAGVMNVLATMAHSDLLPVNLIFVIEGEEEIGSPNLPPCIAQHANLLRSADGVVDFDFSEDTRGKVSMHLGLKGIVYMDLTLQGGKKSGSQFEELHSSVSAWIRSPVWRMVHALASLVERSERIKVEGFYENVAKLSRKDLALLRKLEKVFDPEAFLKEMKSLSFKTNRRGIQLLKTGLYQPVININGIHAGYTGPGTKTVLPRTATAKIDIRFGPNMEGDEVVDKIQRHFKQLGYDDLQIRMRDNYPWSKTDPDDPLVKTMLSAYRAHRIEPQVWPLATWAAPYFAFSRPLELPVVAGGLGHGGHAHARNEYFVVEGLKRFEKFVATFLYKFASQRKNPHTA